MKVIRAFKSGVEKLFANRKMWLLVYMLNVAFALVIALPFNVFLKSTVGNSLAIASSLERFDYTFISDFLNEYGIGFSQILDSSYPVLFLFFLLSIFLMGGIVRSFLYEGFTFNSFWESSRRHFWRLLGLSLIFLLIHVILILIAFQVFSIGGLSPFEIESDAALILKAQIILGGFVFVESIVLMLQDYAKIFVVSEDTNWINKSISKGIGFVRKNFIHCILLFLLQLLIFTVLIFLYYKVRTMFVMSSSSTIWLGLFLGQLFILSRIGIKFSRIGSAVSLIKENNLE